MPEHRSCFRWQINKKAAIRKATGELDTTCQIRDINFKGLQISLPEKLPQDTFLKLTITLSELYVLNAEVWVTWHKVVEGNNHYGLYFTQIKDTEKEKIYRFIHSNFPEALSKQWWQGIEEKGGVTMPEDRVKDARIFDRFSAEFSLKFLNRENGKEGQAQTRDISARGLGVVTKEYLPPRTTLEMWLEVPDKGEPFYTRGYVIWLKQVSPNAYRIGINLEKTDLMGVARLLRAA